MTAFAQNIGQVSENSQELTENSEVKTTSAISSGRGTIDNEKGGITWSIDSKGVLRVTGKGEIAEDNSNGTKIPWSGLEFTSAVIELSEIQDLSYFFADCRNLKSVDLSGLDTSQAVDMSYMFDDCWELVGLNLSNFDTSQVTEMRGMFSDCKRLKTITLDTNRFDTGNVTNMNAMFWGCIRLTEVDLTGFDTRQVTDMSAMFRSCAKLTTLDLGSFDMSSVTSAGIFIGGKDFWDNPNTTLERIYAPVNIPDSLAEIPLPAEAADTWYLLDNSMVTALPKGKTHSVLIQKNQTPTQGISVWVSGNSPRPTITIRFDELESLTSFSLKIDDVEYLNSENWLIYYDESSRTITYPVRTELSEGEHILTVVAADQDGSSLGTPITKTFIVGEPELITKVILAVNNSELRVRAWSNSKEVKTVTAKITQTLTDQNVIVSEYPMEMTTGYYTCLLPIDKSLAQVTVVVSATDSNGRVDRANPVTTVIEDPEAKVVNDLWVRFLDGSGEQKSEYVYTGKAIKPKVQIYEGTTMLTEKKDYTLSYKNNINAGNSATITIKGRGNYNGKETVTFTILPKDITNADEALTVNQVTISEMTAVARGKVQKPVPVIKYGKKKLSSRKNKDFTVTWPDTGEGAYQNPGTYNIHIKGNGNYTGEITVPFMIGGKETKRLRVSRIPNQTYTGSPVTIEGITVKDGRKLLTLGEHYTISYKNNIQAGTASVIITGIAPDYVGTKTINFKIVGNALKKAVIDPTTVPKTVIYNGKEHRPQLKLTWQKDRASEVKVLEEGKDYTVEYRKNIEAGTATILLTGKGSFTGTVKRTFKILPFDARTNEGKLLTIEPVEPAAYAKGGAKPKPIVKFGDVVLTEGKDYTLSYQNNKAVTTEETKKKPIVKVRFKKNFKNSLTAEFTITRQDIGLLSAAAVDKVYRTKKNAWKSTLTIVDLDGKKLQAGRDYDRAITYYMDAACLTKAEAENYPAETTIWVKAEGKGNYAGSSIVTSYQIKKATIAKARVRIARQLYTAYPVTIDYKDITTMKVGRDSLVGGTDYEIVSGSYKNNIKRGTATVQLKGKGNYGGTITVKFAIRQKFFLWRWLPQLEPKK